MVKKIISILLLLIVGVTLFSGCSLAVDDNIKVGNKEAEVAEDNVQLDSIVKEDCNKLKGGEWILVPGNELYGTNNFCVMKYEAKWDGSGTILDEANGYCGCPGNCKDSKGCIDDSEGVISQPSSPPLVLVNQLEAKTLCNRLGPNYHLITNNEWMTIARNIETISSNWVDGNIGSDVMSGGGLKRGNTGEKESSIGYDGDNPESGINRNTLASLRLTNGETIWDFSGNVWEWTNNVIDCSNGYPCVNMPYDGSPESEWIELNAINDYGSLKPELLQPSNLTWNTSYGVGSLYTDSDFSVPSSDSLNTKHAFLRGGGAEFGVHSGAFALNLYAGPSYSYRDVGFRCVYGD